MVLLFNFKAIPDALALIFSSAINPKAALGGAAGITIAMAIQRGIGRGVFSNEAGLGSAPIAAAAAKTKSPVNIGLIFFAFTTIIGWNYYGERCIEYLTGVKGIKLYKIVFILFVGVGPFLSLDLVFIMADIVNGLMALPNLVGLIALRHVVINETNEFFEKLKSESEMNENNNLEVY